MIIPARPRRTFSTSHHLNTSYFSEDKLTLCRLNRICIIILVLVPNLRIYQGRLKSIDFALISIRSSRIEHSFASSIQATLHLSSGFSTHPCLKKTRAFSEYWLVCLICLLLYAVSSICEDHRSIHVYDRNCICYRGSGRFSNCCITWQNLVSRTSCALLLCFSDNSINFTY